MIKTNVIQTIIFGVNAQFVEHAIRLSDLRGVIEFKRHDRARMNQ